MGNRVWFDIEDLFEYVTHNIRMSGIQRVQLELCRAFLALDPKGERIGFLRHSVDGMGFRVIPRESIGLLAGRLDKAGEDAAADANREPGRPPGWKPGPARRALRAVLARMQERPRHHLAMSIVHQRLALVSLRSYLRDPLGRVRVQADPLGGTAATASVEASDPAEDFEAASRAGDIVAILGAIWHHPDYPGLIKRLCHDRGLRFGLLVHDIIPLRRPEWVDRGHVLTFRAWFVGAIALADCLMSVSRATGSDVERYAAQHGLTLRGPVRPIPMGSGFSGGLTSVPAAGEDASGVRALPAPGTYALMVSTIEVRKNHALLFQVWRLLVEELPTDQVPTLVFAGKVGWMVQDLMMQLKGCEFLDGKIVLVENPSDADLRRLYEGCLFTLYPSYFEGWGLPVSESLVFGRPCIIANTTSLPEAGGDLARYFNPYCVTDAHEVIRRTILDRADLAAWRERVQREFRRRPWSETAEAVLRHLGVD